tara:strand:+ start:1282 stop:1560 length:279 start_codon:yes stop_codon:yes gene_type:complete
VIRDYPGGCVILESRKKIKKEYGKYATIQTQSAEDMSQILLWLRMNKAIKAAGQITKSGNTYLMKVRVNPRVGRGGVFRLVKDRFGMFARIR